MSDPEMRPATLADLDEVIDILEEAAAWMAARDLEGWDPGMFRTPDGPGHRALMMALEDEALYLAWQDGHPIATVTLQRSDPLFWPGVPDDAIYIHRLAVRRSAAGSGIGRRLLAWADCHAASLGRTYLRLDTPSRSEVLCRYYTDAGFRQVGEVETPFMAALFERRVAPSENGST